jgi:uncharacterized protein (TIGR02246 family)
MRRSTLGLVITACGAAVACQPAGPAALATADADAIRAAAAAYITAVRDTAWATWADFYANDATVLPPNGPQVSGRDNLIAWARAFPPMTQFTLTQVEVDGRGDLAYVVGRYSMVLAPPGAPEMADSGKYLEIWRRQQDGSWKIMRDMFNSDVPLPEPEPQPRRR